MSSRQYKGSQVDNNRRQLTGSRASANTSFPSHLDLLSARPMGVYKNEAPPDSPPDAMDLVHSDFSEFENRNSVPAVSQITTRPVPNATTPVFAAKSSLRAVRPQMPAATANILARKSAPPPIATTTFARKSAPVPVTISSNQFPNDRQVVLEQRTGAKPETVVPNRPSTNNLSVQKSAMSSSTTTTTPVKGSSSQQNSPPASTLPDNTKLSPQELERIRINRASELYRLQRQKIIDMSQPLVTMRLTTPSEDKVTPVRSPVRKSTASEDEASPVRSPVRQRTASEDEASLSSDDDTDSDDTLSPSPEPPMGAGIMSNFIPATFPARGFRGAARAPRGAGGITRPIAPPQVNAISTAKSTTATLRASRISKIRQQNLELANSSFGQTSTAAPVNQTRGNFDKLTVQAQN